MTISKNNSNRYVAAIESDAKPFHVCGGLIHNTAFDETSAYPRPCLRLFPLRKEAVDDVNGALSGRDKSANQLVYVVLVDASAAIHAMCYVVQYTVRKDHNISQCIVEQDTVR